jgi:hypothetical protein
VAFATVVILVAGLVALGTMAWADGRADDIRAQQYAATRALTQARAQAFDAKANEALTLISRGSGAGFEESWQDSANGATEVLMNAQDVGVSKEVILSFKAYTTVHEQIRRLDDDGDWKGAVALATGPGAEGANAAFATFSQRSGDQLAATAGEIDAGLGGAGTWLNLAALLLLVAGLVAAAAAWFGFSVRLDDYR